MGDNINARRMEKKRGIRIFLPRYIATAISPMERRVKDNLAANEDVYVPFMRKEQ